MLILLKPEYFTIFNHNYYTDLEILGLLYSCFFVVKNKESKENKENMLGSRFFFFFFFSVLKNIKNTKNTKLRKQKQFSENIKMVFQKSFSITVLKNRTKQVLRSYYTTVFKNN